MSIRAQIIQQYQNKIDQIIQEAPELYGRLETVMTKDAIWNLLTEDPSLGSLCRILLEEERILQEAAAVADSTAVMVRRKFLQLKRFESDVIDFFERLKKILQWNAIVDICDGGGRLFARRASPLHIINIYSEYADRRDLAEEVGNAQRDSPSSSSDDFEDFPNRQGSPSSDDSCNRDYY